MPGKALHTIAVKHFEYVIIVDACDCFTCSFTEFLPFHSAMYYYSSYKDFKTILPSWDIKAGILFRVVLNLSNYNHFYA